MHETDRRLLGEKNPIVGCGVAQGSGGTHSVRLKEPRKDVQPETHQMSRKPETCSPPQTGTPAGTEH